MFLPSNGNLNGTVCLTFLFLCWILIREDKKKVTRKKGKDKGKYVSEWSCVAREGMSPR